MTDDSKRWVIKGDSDTGSELAAREEDLPPRLNVYDFIFVVSIFLLGFAIDWVFAAIPTGRYYLPPLITFWVAYRLRKSKKIGWINPFTIGFVSALVVGLIYYAASFLRAQWMPVFNNPSEAPPVLIIVFIALEYGVVLGFWCIVFATVFNRKPAEVDDLESASPEEASAEEASAEEASPEEASPEEAGPEDASPEDASPAEDR